MPQEVEVLTVEGHSVKLIFSRSTITKPRGLTIAGPTIAPMFPNSVTITQLSANAIAEAILSELAEMTEGKGS